MLPRLLILILCSITVFKLVQCEIYRLSKNIKPIRYILTIEPFLHQGLYRGSVIIEIKVIESTNNVTFHKKGIDIDYNEIKIVNAAGAEIQLKNSSENNETETYTILLEDELLKNSYYNLTIGNFSRNFAKNDAFFVGHIYDDNSGENYTFAVTHFEPTGARMTFPCFDEPGLKAKFVIHVIRREGYNSVSNEVMEKTEDLEDGRFKDVFKETPPMPTYTVAFIVSDFKFTVIDERQRLIGSPKTIEKGELNKTMEVAIKALQALENFTGVNYALNKIDQFVVPVYPVLGMENWGLITYRENMMIINNESSAEELQTMTLIVAHEFAHQWFGNLVTPEWWDYVWLSESFADYFQYYIGSMIQPSWKLRDQMLIETVHRSLYEEEFTNAGALNDPIKRSGDMPAWHLMYLKGSAIIRMMEHFLTQDVFRNGIQIYLQNKKFSAATPSDLYSALQEAVDNAGANNLLGNMRVADILTTWDSTKGFPTVTVERNYTSGSVTLTQSSVNIQPRIIPINYVFSTGNATDFSKTTADYWLTKENATLDNNFPTDGWVIVNIQETGYYRVNYDLENWERLIKFMNSDNFTSIHALNRAQLIDDAFSFALNKMIPVHIPLRLSRYLIREKDYIPLTAFYNAHSYIMKLYKRSVEGEYECFHNYALVNTISANATLKDLYKEYVRSTLGGIAEYLGTEPKPDDTHLDKLIRKNIRYYYH